MGELKIALEENLGRVYPALGRLAQAGSPRGARSFGTVLKELQRGLTGERRLVSKAYFSQHDYLGAYLLYYWPVSFAQVYLALTELEARGCLPNEPRVLDLGAGPGPASFAALAKGAKSCLLLDSSALALDTALLLARDILPTRASRLAVSTRVFDLENEASLPSGPFDLVIACHSINELWKNRSDALERRAGLLERAAAELSDGGILLIIEPSASATAIPALELRDRLIGASGLSGKPILRCLAPCPASLPCPALRAGEGRSCHSTWPWTPPPAIAALATEAGLDRDSAKATWFALAKSTSLEGGEEGRQNGGTRDDGTLNLLAAAGSEINAVTDCLAGRVVSEPLLNKAGRIRYIVCAGDGLSTISAPSASATTISAAGSGFLGLRRGDCFRACGLSRRPGERSFGFDSGSRIDITFKTPELL